ncbi:hypothetical protein D3C75_988170 [compost metagenome]
MLADRVDAHQPGLDRQLEVAEGMGQAIHGAAVSQAQAVLVGQIVELGDVVQLRQAPQTTPQAAGRAAVKQDGAFVVGQQWHQCAPLRQRLARFGLGVAGFFAVQVRFAAALQRADQATGLAARAQRGAHVHHRLGVVVGALLRGKALGSGP